ncbi:NACHT domain-containing protein [Parapedobacter sp. DT-150]|uniref:NACHT domain-containing protein n=1 Tax=Parapedobacter sp. DT-150 TaxID=3396162 RepID=UPI003F1D70BE
MELIKELIGKPLDAFWSTLGAELKNIISNRMLEYEIEEYERNYYTKTIVHRTEPVKLFDFYLPLHIRKHGNNYKEDRLPTLSCRDLFADHSDFLTIMGTAGSGKSTIVKYLVVKAIEEKFKIPIKVELRYLNSYSGSLNSFIEHEIFKFQQLAFDNNIIDRLLKSGNFIFFFDGYDELSSHVKDGITRNINDFTKLYNKNSYLLTTRPFTNIELLSKFRNFEVCPLSEAEIEQFVRKQIPPKEKETANKIVEAANSAENSNYTSYLSNPLLLSMFILTYQTYSNVPPKRSSFYRQVFESLFYLHDSMSKLSWTREKKSGLNKEQFEYVLQLFSFISFFHEMFVFDISYIEAILNQIKDKKKSIEFDNKDLLDDLQVGICILNKEGIDYVFPHRSLQEYFASQYIVNLDPKNKKEIYKRILDQFVTSDIVDYFTKDNFYSLIAEQDPMGVIRNISIPYFEEVNQKIKLELTEEQKANLIDSVRYFSLSFHTSHIDLTQLFRAFSDFADERNRLFKEIFSRNRKLKNENGNIKLLKTESEKLSSIYNNQIKNLKHLLPSIIKNCRGFLRDEENSDSGIIDLI